MTTKVMTTQVSGNTKPSTPVFKGRSFLLTLNEVVKFEGLKDEFLKLKSCDFLIASLEVAPTTGHEHIHMYCHFTAAYRLNRRLLSYGAHVDVCKGSPKQNIDYVRKDGNVICVYGTEPRQGVAKTVKELKDEQTPDELDWRQYKTWKQLHDEMNNDIDIDDWNKTVNVWYIYGASGVGKTERAKEIVRTFENKKVNIVKNINGFWHGVGNAETAIYDDFRDSDMKASEFINFIDYNKHEMNVKGGSKVNDYKNIIITSIQDPHSIYKNMDDEPRKQWLRRMKIEFIE